MVGVTEIDLRSYWPARLLGGMYSSLTLRVYDDWPPDEWPERVDEEEVDAAGVGVGVGVGVDDGGGVEVVVADDEGG